MNEPRPDSELVVATPERVAFEYRVGGLATRGIAQVLDLTILSFVLAGVLFLGYAIGDLGSSTVGFLVAIIGSFVVVFGYFWLCEAFWSGQTVGKKVFRLRAVGDRGEPLTFIQAGVRNIVRIVDFLPYGYGLGLVVLFVNGRGKRLGDLAAGTIVVKDSDAVALWQLAGSPPQSAAGVFAPASDAEVRLRRLDPRLRRFVVAYERRRFEVPLDLRAQLAGQLQAQLAAAAPDVFNQYGPLATLDYLADLERQA